MIDLDNEVMDFKLSLRSTCKPGDIDLWELDDLYSHSEEDGWVLQASDNSFIVPTYTVSYPLAIIDELPLLAYFNVFSDHGEWELELVKIEQKG